MTLVKLNFAILFADKKLFCTPATPPIPCSATDRAREFERDRIEPLLGITLPQKASGSTYRCCRLAGQRIVNRDQPVGVVARVREISVTLRRSPHRRQFSRRGTPGLRELFPGDEEERLSFRCRPSETRTGPPMVKQY